MTLSQLLAQELPPALRREVKYTWFMTWVEHATRGRELFNDGGSLDMALRLSDSHELITASRSAHRVSLQTPVSRLMGKA